MSLDTIFNAVVPLVWAYLAWGLWRSDRREHAMISGACRLIEANNNANCKPIQDNDADAADNASSPEDQEPAVPEWWVCQGSATRPHPAWLAHRDERCGECGLGPSPVAPHRPDEDIVIGTPGFPRR
jgi:hypothetical protein